MVGVWSVGALSPETREGGGQSFVLGGSRITFLKCGRLKTVLNDRKVRPRTSLRLEKFIKKRRDVVASVFR